MGGVALSGEPDMVIAPYPALGEHGRNTVTLPRPVENYGALGF